MMDTIRNEILTGSPALSDLPVVKGATVAYCWEHSNQVKEGAD